MSTPTSQGKTNGKPVGAVIVWGGGSAGMQASLDLGDQGSLRFRAKKTFVLFLLQRHW